MDRRRQRIQNSLETQMAGRRRGHCTWCGVQVVPPRQSWCSDACVTAHRLLTSSSAYRPFVFARDSGRCRRCGLDLARWERLIERWRRTCEPVVWHPVVRAVRLPGSLVRVPTMQVSSSGRALLWDTILFEEPAVCRQDRQERAQRLARVLLNYRMHPDRTIWEVDHIIPLVDGGAHALSNLQLLCRPCHVEVTGVQSRARRGRPAEAR